MSARHILAIVAMTITLLLPPPEVRADKVLLKNGRVVTGRITAETPKEVTVQLDSGYVALPRSQIKEIQKDSGQGEVFTKGDALLKKGDAFLAGNLYADAMQQYEAALQSAPLPARSRLAKARTAWADQMLKDMKSVSLADQEDQLRKQIQRQAVKDPSVPALRTALARVLMQKTKQEMDHLYFANSVSFLTEAWNLSPDTPGLAGMYVGVLERNHKPAEEIAEMLRAHVKNYPDNMEAIDLLLPHIWEKEPWAALGMAYPDNAPHPMASEKTKEMLPQILLACFNARPYPAGAPFDRASCYERLMALQPNASPLPLLLCRVELKPDSVQDLDNLGAYYLGQKDFGNALPVLRKLTSLRNDARTLETVKTAEQAFEKDQMAKASRLLDEKHPRESQQVCEQALQLLPGNKACSDFLLKVRCLERCELCNATGMNVCQTCKGAGSIQVEKTRLVDDVALEFTRMTPQPAGAGKGALCAVDMRGVTDVGSLVQATEHLHQVALQANDIVPNQMYSFKCKYCGWGYSVITKYAFRTCPICKKGGGKRSVPYQVTESCTQCSGKGYVGQCATCQGRGLITLQEPREIAGGVMK